MDDPSLYKNTEIQNLMQIQRMILIQIHSQNIRVGTVLLHTVPSSHVQACVMGNKSIVTSHKKTRQTIDLVFNRSPQMNRNIHI